MNFSAENYYRNSNYSGKNYKKPLFRLHFMPAAFCAGVLSAAVFRSFGGGVPARRRFPRVLRVCRCRAVAFPFARGGFVTAAPPFLMCFMLFAPATATFAPRVLKSFFGCEIIRSNAAESREIFPKKEK